MSPEELDRLAKIGAIALWDGDTTSAKHWEEIGEGFRRAAGAIRREVLEECARVIDSWERSTGTSTDSTYYASLRLRGAARDIRSLATPPASREEEAGTSCCNRCERCGWPLASSQHSGCMPGDCSQRPLPAKRRTCAGCGKLIQTPSPAPVASAAANSGPINAGPAAGVRPVVARFAEAMEAELRENDHKGGWDDEHEGDLLERLTQEKAELSRVVRGPIPRPSDTHDRSLWVKRVLSEAADVANFAMMIADVCGALPKTPSPHVAGSGHLSRKEQLPASTSDAPPAPASSVQQSDVGAAGTNPAETLRQWDAWMSGSSLQMPIQLMTRIGDTLSAAAKPKPPRVTSGWLVRYEFESGENNWLRQSAYYDSRRDARERYEDEKRKETWSPGQRTRFVKLVPLTRAKKAGE